MTAAGHLHALPDAAAVMRQAPLENFPVASRLLPRQMRAHLLAVYGFARLVDDTGDESPGDRLALLDHLEAEMDLIYGGGEPEHPLLRRLVPTIHACAIPPEPFRALIEANRQDQRVASYDTIDDLLAYCALSANPVGHLVLYVFGAATPIRRELSDSICTALQLIEHWQDVAEDRARGRVYIPLEDQRRFGCTDNDLLAPRACKRLKWLMAFEALRARELLERGTPLIETLSGRPRLAVGAFVAGGHAALAAIERADWDVLAGPPRATRVERLVALSRTLRRRRNAAS